LPGNYTFGFFEAHPRDPALSFTEFVAGVLARNGPPRTFSFFDTNTYQMTSGATIRFTIPNSTTNKYKWPVVGTGDTGLDQLGTDISQWPLAFGEILNSVGHSGIVTFENPDLRGRITLDFSDVGEPRRTEP
jgi:hypothetical protein